LVTTNATILLFNFVSLEREDLDWTDLYAEKASFTVDFIPEDIQPWLHTICRNGLNFNYQIPCLPAPVPVPTEGGVGRNEPISILSKPNRIKLPF
jgi:hypothetical protein